MKKNKLKIISSIYKMVLEVKTISQRFDDTILSNFFHVNIKGDDINFVLVNALRRILLEDIPGFAFNDKKISIKANSSVYNNDYLRNRIENFPIHGINNIFNIDEYNNLKDLVLKKEIVDEVDEIENQLLTEDGIVSNNEDNKSLKNISLLNMYVNMKNENDDIMNVTTDNCNFFINGESKKNIYKNPLLICKLKKGEELELSAIVDKNIPEFHSKYSVVGSCVYEQIKDNEFLFKFDNRSDIKNNEILSIACEVLIFRLKNFLKKIEKEKFTTDTHGKIIINNESHTLGNLIGRALQDSNNIEFAAYKKDHLLINDITLEYVTNGSKTINEILNICLTKQINLLDSLKAKFKKLS